VLALLSALSWSVGNVLLTSARGVDVLSLVVWASLVPPLPAVALSLALDGRQALLAALAHPSPTGVVAALYLGLIATVAAYAVWGWLLRRHPAATVAPFALLVPFVAATGSGLIFGERFGRVRLAGMALVLLGLAVIVLPARRGAPAVAASRPA